MSAIVGLDAKIELFIDSTWVEVSERNEFTINIRVDSAEKKTFVADPSLAWSRKSRTWMSWSGSLRGYYDDADDTIFNQMVEGQELQIRLFDSRASDKHWAGTIVLTSIEHSTGTDDFVSHSVDFEGQGVLERKLTVV